MTKPVTEIIVVSAIQIWSVSIWVRPPISLMIQKPLSLNHEKTFPPASMISVTLWMMVVMPPSSESSLSLPSLPPVLSYSILVAYRMSLWTYELLKPSSIVTFPLLPIDS